jgi:hypothetical protein
VKSTLISVEVASKVLWELIELVRHSFMIKIDYNFQFLSGVSRLPFSPTTVD